jgi:methylmalonyl-CoA decarboxylase
MVLIKTKINKKIAILSLNNEKKLNALSKLLIEECVAFLKECRTKKVLTVLIKAEPNKQNVWSAGHDINELPEGHRDPLGYYDPLERLLRKVREYPGPVIAAVKGSVWGGACDLIMTCDLVYADKTSTFAITPAKIGIPYNISGILHFINRIGLNMAKEMFFTAKPIGAEKAEKWGIVNQVLESNEVEAKALEAAQQICVNSPLAISVIKEQFRILSDAEASLTPIAFERIEGLRREVYDSHDYSEGIRSFKEKRKPVFLGE